MKHEVRVLDAFSDTLAGDHLADVVVANERGEFVVTNFGIEDLRYSATTPMGGASCVAAVQSAVMAVASGVAHHVLIPIGRNGASQSRIGDRVREMPQFRVSGEYERPVGSIAPAQLYAQMARRHMALYGTRSEQLAEIAVTVRNHALLNDNALMKKPMTVEDLSLIHI